MIASLLFFVLFAVAFLYATAFYFVAAAWKESYGSLSDRFRKRLDDLVAANARNDYLTRQLAATTFDATTSKHLYRELLSKPIGGLTNGDRLLLWMKPKPRFEAGAKVCLGGELAIVLSYDDLGRPRVAVPGRGVTVAALDSMLTEGAEDAGGSEDGSSVDEESECDDPESQSVGTSLCGAGSSCGAAEAGQPNSD